MPRLDLIALEKDLAFAGAGAEKGGNFQFAVPKTVYKGSSGSGSSFTRESVLAAALESETNGLTQSGS